MTEYAERAALRRLIDAGLSGAVVTEGDFGTRAILASNGSGVVASVNGTPLATSVPILLADGTWSHVVGGVRTVVGRVTGDYTDLNGVILRKQLLTLDANNSEVTSVNDTAFFSIYAPTIPANTLDRAGGVRADIFGTYVNDSGANQRLDYEIDLGLATYFGTSTTNTIATNAETRVWHMVVTILADGATDEQQMWVNMELGQADSVTTGIGGVTSRYGGAAGMWNCDDLCAEDSTGALVLDIKLRHTAAHASLTFTKMQAWLEICR